MIIKKEGIDEKGCRDIYIDTNRDIDIERRPRDLPIKAGIEMTKMNMDIANPFLSTCSPSFPPSTFLSTKGEVSVCRYMYGCICNYQSDEEK